MNEQCEFYHLADSLTFSVQALIEADVFDGEKSIPQTEIPGGECHVKRINLVTHKWVIKTCLTDDHNQCPLFENK